MSASAITPAKVGLFVVLGAVALFVFLSFIGGGVKGGTDEYYATFSDASGLAPLTQVRVAGITVGEVTRIELQDGRARVWFRIRDDIKLYPDAKLSKRAESILGDYLLDLNPGTPASGPPVPPSGSAAGPRGLVIPASVPAPPREPLEPGSEVRNVEEAVAMEQLLRSMARISEDLEVITSALRRSIAGDERSVEKIVENLQSVSEQLDETMRVSSEQLRVILEDTRAITGDVRRITERNDEDVEQIIANVRTITEQTKSVMSTVQSIVGSNEGDLTDSVAGLKDALGSLNRSLQNIEAMTARVEQGEGVLGRLATDEELGERLELAIEDGSDFISRLTNLQTEITLRSEYLFAERQTKNYLQLRIIPRPDRYYFFELVDDPRGSVERQIVVRSPPGADEVANQEVRITRESLKLSAQYARRYGFATFRFGLVESTGGLGLNLHFLQDTLELRLDAFEFTNPEKTYPRLRGFLNFVFLQHLFVSGGIDDAFNDRETEVLTGRILSGRDYFLGGGLYFTDQDLAAILTVAPGP